MNFAQMGNAAGALEQGKKPPAQQRLVFANAGMNGIRHCAALAQAATHGERLIAHGDGHVHPFAHRDRCGRGERNAVSLHRHAHIARANVDADVEVHGLRSLLRFLVFFPRGLAAADVPFGLVLC